MISTQRLILLVIGINLFIGLVGELWETPTDYDDFTQIQTEISNMENVEVDMSGEDGIWGSVKRSEGQEETTIGSAINWGFSIGGLLWKGLNPFSIHAGMFSHPLEKALAYVLIIFRSLIATILGVELVFIFKNKKAT